MENNSVRMKIQKFGTFLSGMVMPNIGAFITWGLITACFLKTGWFPNERLAELIGPTIKYLLPILIGFTGGRMVYGIRGGVIGAAATMGVVVGSDIPMFMGAMMMGPFSGWVLKKFDKLIDGKIKPGFEMLVNNFSSGIIGMGLTLLAFYAVGPMVLGLNKFLGTGVNMIINANLLPFSSIFIEPAKVLFLNNAINHGILSPIGIAQAAKTGKSILFLLEPNPGPGLGVLLAYTVFGKGIAKSSAPGVAIIHAIGGIHEPYFPFILMKPIMILAAIAGAVSGNIVFQLSKVGLVATSSPGSVFSILAVAPRTDYVGILLGITLSTAVSFAVGSFILKVSPNNDDSDMQNAIDQKDQMKGLNQNSNDSGSAASDLSTVKKIVVACDAGMGSSTMGANLLRKRIQKEGLNIEVINKAITEIPSDADIIVTHKDLTERAKSGHPQKIHLSLTNFVDKGFYDNLVDELAKKSSSEEKIQVEEIKTEKVLVEKEKILNKKNIKLGLGKVSKEEAVSYAGKLLFESGYVGEDYIQGMLNREKKADTYLEYNIAIPHGEIEVKESIKKTGIVVLQYPEGIDYGNGNIVKLLIGIAAKGDDHIEMLAKLSNIFDEEEEAEKLVNSNDVDYIYGKLI